MKSPVIAWKPARPTPEIASVRLRCYRPLEYLRAAGWTCEIFDRTQMHRYRIVIFQKAYGEEDLAIAAHLRGIGVRTVFDLCDNHFVGPLDRTERLRRMIDSVDAVTVATAELAKVTGRRAHVIDDALDTVERDWRSRLRRMAFRGKTRRPLRVAWFGNAGQEDPPFGLIDLGRIRPQLEALHSRRPLHLTVISNSRASFNRFLGGARFPLGYHDWDNRLYQRILRGQDLCVIPISVNAVTRCKTVNRLALSLLLGVPAAADSIPSYEELRPFALLGDWDDGLYDYLLDDARRWAAVRLGQRYLRAKYTPERVVEQWAAVLRGLIGATGPRFREAA
jgi:hypothetical protein